MNAEALRLLMEAIAPVVKEAAQEAAQDLCGRLMVLEAGQTRVTRLEASLDTLTLLLGDMRERVATVETRPPEPGPMGPAGPAGLNGKDGTPGLVYCGVYTDGQAYTTGELVTWAGSTWHCHEATTTKPGDGSKAWQLMVKRGRDGKDGKP